MDFVFPTLSPVPLPTEELASLSRESAEQKQDRAEQAHAQLLNAVRNARSDVVPIGKASEEEQPAGGAPADAV